MKINITYDNVKNALRRRNNIFKVVTGVGAALTGVIALAACGTNNTPAFQPDFSDNKPSYSDTNETSFTQASGVVYNSSSTTTTTKGEPSLNPREKFTATTVVSDYDAGELSETAVVTGTSSKSEGRPPAQGTQAPVQETQASVQGTKSSKTSGTKASNSAFTTTTTKVNVAPKVTDAPKVTEAPKTQATEPETTPAPIIDPETPVLGEACLQNIGSNWFDWSYFSDEFQNEIKAYRNGIYQVDIGYGYTNLWGESCFALQALNYNYFNNDDVIGSLYDDYNYDDIVNFKKCLFMLRRVQELNNADVDYSKYTIDTCVGDFLNLADDAYRNGSFDDFMINNFCNGNPDSIITNNPGAMAILYSYDNGKYLSFDGIDASLNDVVNRISNVKFGYTK